MPEKDKIYETKVKRSGIFDFKDLYQFVYKWLLEEEYNLTEKKYIESVKGDSKDIEIIWEAFRKVSDYFKFQLRLSWRILGLTDIEAEKDGKKIKTNKGSFEIKISGILVKDYQNTWEKTPSMKFLRGIYDKYIIKSRIESYEGKLIEEINDLSEEIKAFLTIEGKTS